MGSKKMFSSFEEMEALRDSNKDKTEHEVSEKEEYQAEWKKNKFKFRQMISSKNRKWIKKSIKDSNFIYIENRNDESFDLLEKTRNKIEDYFSDGSKRKWLIHILSNFIPIGVSAYQAPKLPKGKHICPFTDLVLTDTDSLLTGDRDKHIAYTGIKTNVLLSSIALQALEEFVLECTYDFDTQNGQIVNFAIDEVRNSQKD